MSTPSPNRARSFLVRLTADRHSWLALLLTVPAMLPLLASGYFFNAHDARHSVYFLVEFDRAFRAGALWPVWGPDLAIGFGYPIWLIYAPLAYFAGQGFHLLGLGFTAATKATWALGFILGALGTYRLARRWWGPAAGLAASVAFTYAPYHLVQIYVRAALAEFMALAWLPWVALALVALWDTPGPRRAALAALAVAGLLMLHTVSMLTFVPLIAGLMLVLWLRDLRQESTRIHPHSSAPDARVIEGPTRRSSGFSRSDAGDKKPAEASPPVSTRGIFSSAAMPHRGAIANENAAEHPCGLRLRTKGCSPVFRLAAMSRAAQAALKLQLSAFFRARPRPIFRADANSHGQPRWPRAAAWTVAAAALGGLLAAIFLAPMLLERGNIVESQWVSATYNYRNHFVYLLQFLLPTWGFGYSVPGAGDGMSFQLGLAIIPLAVAGAAAALRNRPASLPHRPEALFLVVISLVALFMMTPASAALWDVLPLVELVQFPWRLLAIQVFALALLVGIAAHRLERRQGAGRQRTLALAGVVAALMLASLPYVRAQLAPVEPWRESTLAIFDFELKFQDMRGMTRWSERQPQDADSPLIAQYLAGEEIRRAAIVAGEGAILAQEAGALHARATVQAAGPVRLRFYTYYFPGWRGTVNGQPVELHPDPPNGLIGLDLPAGQHEVVVRFGPTPVRTLAAGLSGAGLVIVAGLALAGHRRKAAVR